MLSPDRVSFVTIFKDLCNQGNLDKKQTHQNFIFNPGYRAGWKSAVFFLKAFKKVKLPLTLSFNPFPPPPFFSSEMAGLLVVWLSTTPP